MSAASTCAAVKETWVDDPNGLYLSRVDELCRREKVEQSHDAQSEEACCQFSVRLFRFSSWTHSSLVANFVNLRVFQSCISGQFFKLTQVPNLCCFASALHTDCYVRNLLNA